MEETQATKKSIFMGIVEHEVIETRKGNIDNDGIRWSREPYNHVNKEYVDKKFYECELEPPTLNCGDELYVNELDITVHINKMVRSVEGETIYFTDHIIETIPISQEENEQAKQTLKESLEDYYYRLGKLQKILDKKNKKWYQFWD